MTYTIDQTEIQQVVDQFFRAVEHHDMNELPLGDTASYSGTMLPEPAMGAAAVRQYMSGTAPFIRSFDLEKTIIGQDSAAILVEYEAVNGVRFEGAYFLDIKEGRITRIRTVFDSRPLMQGGMDKRP